MNSLITDWIQVKTGSSWEVQPERIVQTVGKDIYTTIKN